MKKILAVVLALIMLLPYGMTVRGETVASKPFYGMGWSDINRIKFPNLEGLVTIGIGEENGKIYFEYAGKTDIGEIAKSVKTMMDKLPEGMRQMHLWSPNKVYRVAPEHVVYLDKGVDQMEALFTEFIEKFHALGGKLEGMVVDVEYVEARSWYIYLWEYMGKRDGNTINENIYNDIVNDPRYATEIRPMLVERDFQFYENVGGIRSEIYSIYPNRYLPAAEREKYSECAAIWDAVMNIRMGQYLTRSLYEPMIKYYPEATFSDYQVTDTNAWLKDLSDSGDPTYIGGNRQKAGDVSNYNTYSARPSTQFFEDTKGNAVYKNPIAYNEAVYKDDAYHMFMWEINKFKNMYAATDTNKVSIWVAEYDYKAEREGSSANTPYYTETLFHSGLLDPQPYLLWIYSASFESVAEYNARIKVVSEILFELTRVAGFADRKPIRTPSTWNSDFVLSGMYANGRNVWRITPDTNEVSLENFKVAGTDPTFFVNGQTVTFPQGKIIPDGTISAVGTCGYWVETPKDVTPVITNAADRYKQYPSYAEDFEGYAAGTALDSATAQPRDCWVVEGTKPTVTAQGSGNALALTGTVTVENAQLPANITAGDSYARQQAWEVSFTLPEAMQTGNVKLLTTSGDGGIKLEGGKVYYDSNGTYQELAGVTLTPGQKYAVQRDVNFADAYTCTYSVYDGSGKLLAQAVDVPMRTNTVVPVYTIGMSCADLTTRVLIDDYKLYPTGFAADFELYNAKTGILQTDTGKANSFNTAYRLSWLNATDLSQTKAIVASYYDSSNKLLSETTIKRIKMAPGCDGVETGIVEVKEGQRVVVQVKTAAEEPVQTTPTTAPTTVPTTQPITQPTQKPTTQPTTAPTIVPTTQATTVPTTTQSTTVSTVFATTPSTDVPTTLPGTEATTLPTSTPTTATPTTASTAPDSNERENGNWVLPVVIVAVILIGVAGGVWLFIKKKHE